MQEPRKPVHGRLEELRIPSGDAGTG
jgi:hypothetical protein